MLSGLSGLKSAVMESVGPTSPRQHFQKAVPSRRNIIKRQYQLGRKCLQNHPNGTLADKTQYHIGIAYVNLKKYGEGIQSFRQVLSNYPGSNWDDNARYQIGWVFYKQERYPEAITAFNEMLKVHPGSQLVPRTIFGIANAYFKQGKYSQAMREYQRGG